MQERPKSIGRQLGHALQPFAAFQITAVTPNTCLGGAGELGVPTTAPAIANAYYQATKKRIRALPFFPNATMGD